MKTTNSRAHVPPHTPPSAARGGGRGLCMRVRHEKGNDLTTTADNLRQLAERARTTADRVERQDPPDEPRLLHLRLVEYGAAALDDPDEQAPVPRPPGGCVRGGARLPAGAAGAIG